MQPYKDSLTGKVALVTGAGSGIGKATAKLFAQAGARVGVLTQRPEEADATCGEIRGAGGQAISLVVDVSKPAEIERAVQKIKETWGRLDIVVANAGINGLWAPIEEISEDEWEKTTHINLKGTFFTIKSAVPLLKRAGGAVVITSSVQGTRVFSNSGASVYASTKAAQAALGRMLALELAQFRVRVNTICPGSIRTNLGQNTEQKDLEQIKPPVIYPEGQVPLTHGESGHAEQVAQLAWFLVSDVSSHVTGTEVFIDGGESLMTG